MALIHILNTPADNEIVQRLSQQLNCKHLPVCALLLNGPAHLTESVKVSQIRNWYARMRTKSSPSVAQASKQSRKISRPRQHAKSSDRPYAEMNLQASSVGISPATRKATPAKEQQDLSRTSASLRYAPYSIPQRPGYASSVNTDDDDDRSQNASTDMANPQDTIMTRRRANLARQTSAGHGNLLPGSASGADCPHPGWALQRPSPASFGLTPAPSRESTLTPSSPHHGSPQTALLTGYRRPPISYPPTSTDPALHSLSCAASSNPAPTPALTTPMISTDTPANLLALSPPPDCLYQPANEEKKRLPGLTELSLEFNAIFGPNHSQPVPSKDDSSPVDFAKYLCTDVNAPLKPAATELALAGPWYSTVSSTNGQDFPIGPPFGASTTSPWNSWEGCLVDSQKSIPATALQPLDYSPNIRPHKLGVDVGRLTGAVYPTQDSGQFTFFLSRAWTVFANSSFSPDLGSSFEASLPDMAKSVAEEAQPDMSFLFPGFDFSNIEFDATSPAPLFFPSVSNSPTDVFSEISRPSSAAFTQQANFLPSPFGV